MDESNQINTTTYFLQSIHVGSPIVFNDETTNANDSVSINNKTTTNESLLEFLTSNYNDNNETITNESLQESLSSNYNSNNETITNSNFINDTNNNDDNNEAVNNESSFQSLLLSNSNMVHLLLQDLNRLDDNDISRAKFWLSYKNEVRTVITTRKTEVTNQMKSTVVHCK